LRSQAEQQLTVYHLTYGPDGMVAAVHQQSPRAAGQNGGAPE
jgi:hypothetical protein